MNRTCRGIFMLIIGMMIPTVLQAGGNVVYDFESISNGGNSFSSSGQTFTISPELLGVVLATYGSDLNGNLGTSDGYMDTGFETSQAGNVGGINAPAGMTFRAQRFDVWPSENQGGVVQATGSLVRVLGFRDGQQIVSADVAMTDFGQAVAANVRWHRIDLSTTAFATANIDSVQFELIGQQDYIAVDNFIYSDLQIANNLPVISGSVANQAVNDDATIVLFQSLILTDADGDNIALSVTLDDNNTGVFTPASLSASGFTGTGPYQLSSRSTVLAQDAIRQLVFDPTENLVAPGQTTTTVFNIESSDAFGSANDNNTSVVSTSIDQDPLAVADVATVLEDANPTTIAVLNNDTDADGGPRTVTASTQPANGTVSNNFTDVSYQPDTDYCNDGNPTDNFNYTVNNNSSAQVSVSVTCVNDAPTFTVLGDVDATGLVDQQNTQVQVTGFAKNVQLGPANESGQSVLGYLPVCVDPDTIIDFMVIDNQGNLTIDFTLNYGVANCSATLLDNGGTSNGGQNTSDSVPFVVSLTDVIFASGFETLETIITSLEKQLRTQYGSDINLYFNENTYRLELMSQNLQLNPNIHLATQQQLIKQWTRQILEH